MKTGAVIVAAGLSSRMGDFKPLLQMGSVSIAKRIILNFQAAGVSPVVVVTGYRAEELEAHLRDLDVSFVRNPAFRTTEMFDSAKIGFAFIRDRCDRTFFTPVDIPLFSSGTVVRLMQSEAEIAKPVCAGKVGHPLLLSRAMLDRILLYQGTDGLRGALRESGAAAERIAVEDEGILNDADTPDEYQALLRQSAGMRKD